MRFALLENENGIRSWCHVREDDDGVIVTDPQRRIVPGKSEFYLDDLPEQFRTAGYDRRDHTVTICQTAEADHEERLDWSNTYLVDTTWGSGWLDREGRFYPCWPQSHDQLAHLVLHKTVWDMERQGWARVWFAPGKRPPLDVAPEGYGPCFAGDSTWTMESRLRLSAEQRNWLSEHGHNLCEED